MALRGARLGWWPWETVGLRGRGAGGGGQLLTTPGRKEARGLWGPAGLRLDPRSATGPLCCLGEQRHLSEPHLQSFKR